MQCVGSARAIACVQTETDIIFCVFCVGAPLKGLSTELAYYCVTVMRCDELIFEKY